MLFPGLRGKTKEVPPSKDGPASEAASGRASRTEGAESEGLKVVCSCQSGEEFALREHRYYGRTVSVCSVCGRRIDAKVVERDGKAYLDKYCPEHGRSVVLVSSSFARYVGQGAVMIHGRIPGQFATEVKRGCPEDCGYCPQHEQHACSGLIEITGQCNMACPICYADLKAAGPISFEDYCGRLDTLERVEGRIDVLQLSGGEPTLHPELFAFLEEARRRRPNRILLNTNGRRIASDAEFVDRLAAFRDVLDVYLQYDGDSAETAMRLRGEDVRAEKEVAVKRLAEAGVKVILVATIDPENLKEVPTLVERAVATEGVTGLTFQTLSHCGRNRFADSSRRVTAADIIDAMTRLAWLEPSDVFPLPCTHPYCTQLCYVYCRPGRKPFPMIRLSTPGEIVGSVKNRLSFNADTMEQLTPKIRCVTLQNRLRVSNILPALDVRRFFRNAKQAEWKGRKILRIVVKQFMDAETFDASRAARCCIGVVTRDGRVIPFCSYNTIHREREHVPGT